MSFLQVLVVIVGLVLPCVAGAQDLPSGPDKDKKVPPLKVFDATGPNKDKEVDYAAERKDKPTIYILIQAEKWDRPMARFLRKLDQALNKEEEDSYLVAVWLTDSPEKTKEYLPVAQQSLQLQKTALACFTREKEEPKDWNINGDTNLTAVVTTKGKVISTFGYRSVNETDAPAVYEAYKKALKQK